MPRRLHQSMADYIVIAISPALIMGLVGSLVFFLLGVFYQGEYQERLHWVMACFVFAAVLIGRIAIEEGFERAAMFGAALAIVMGMAANRFMEFHGGWIDHFSWLINWSLIALVWWCAHRLTWDCTLIDDSQDSSGQGLLQVAGLEQSPGGDGSNDESRRLEGTTSREVPTGFWERYVEHQRRPHAPGVSVVYFSLAALPLFGIGQWLIPESDAIGRRNAFWLLSIYVASGLGLLLTTSFLGLRRYLRQRRIEMPTLMANLWLGTGTVVIGILLVVAAILPRPSAEFAISNLPFEFGSPRQASSRIAPVSKEGAQDDKSGDAEDRQPQEDSDKANSPEPENANGHSSQDADPDTKRSSPAGASSRPDAEESVSRKSGSSSQDSQPSPKSSSQQSKSSSQQSQSSGSSKSSSGDRQQAKDKQQQSGDDGREKSKPEDSQEGDRSPPSEQAKSESPPEREDRASQFRREIENRQREAAKNSQPEQPTENPPREVASKESSEQGESAEARDGTSSMVENAGEAIAATTGVLAEWLRWAVNGLVVLVGIYGCWRFRAEIARTIREFLSALADLWARLTGRKRVKHGAGEEVREIDVPPAPFASYADPFATGIYARYAMTELVRYSFEAFEAWAREHGCPRQPDQTPHELARDVGELNASIKSDARTLAELYARAAYDRGELPATAEQHLRRLWQAMRQDAAASAWDDVVPPPTGQV